MNSNQHIGEVLLPHVWFFHGAFGDAFCFMDDNVICRLVISSHVKALHTVKFMTACKIYAINKGLLLDEILWKGKLY